MDFDKPGMASFSSKQWTLLAIARKALHLSSPTVTTMMRRGLRLRLTDAIAISLTHVGFSATEKTSISFLST